VLGAVLISGDGGKTFDEKVTPQQPMVELEGEPARLKAVDGRHLYVALTDGSILESRDGARSWTPVYTRSG
jgi:photosystem II stability/assembly factor-like uncharacterized protein